MSVRTDADIEDYVWRLLPDYVREDDNGDLKAFMGKATLSAMAPALRLADVADPDTSPTRTAEIANPAAAPRPWLRWLAYLAGVDISNVADSDQRATIANATVSQRRGSSASIIRATKPTLSGTRSCRVYWNLSGSDPYLLTVVTLTSQTASTVATLAAAMTEKPAGIDLELVTVPGALYSELATEFAGDDYDDLAAAYTGYDDLADWIP